ncbi:thermonuclease family protein [[Mycoplasma] gypis]|uniref:Thermonuclease family protein n=1 Tax=[Mycoplasma] gypis TaxID=92404 RepID=A0ABZ2RPX5_9BACT|nr:thermonuclease family protein [[Mycoplasma] gypis]MBN0919140.1 thermonuclease family protein [[Mycoplasma] gypis]
MKKYFRFLKLLLIGSLAISPVFLSAQSCKNNEQSHLVQRKLQNVIDGDTILDENNVMYRFLGIDTPESRKKVNDTWIETTGIEKNFATKAKNFTLQRLKENNFVFFVDTDLKQDKYGRSLAKIYLDDKRQKMLNVELVKNGLALQYYISLNPKNIYYTKDVDFYLLLQNAQLEARVNKRGFWNLQNVAIIFPKHH